MADDSMNALHRAAMAIAIVRGKQWLSLNDTERLLYLEDARAVLISLQDPTDEMVQEGVKCLDHSEDGILGGLERAVLDVFAAMMKTALRR